MLVLTIVIFCLPFLWLLLPIILFDYLKYWAVGVYIGMYFLWAAENLRIPREKISHIKNENYLDAFRPKARKIVKLTQKNFPEGVKTLTEQPEIEYVLLKSELADTDFKQKLLSAPKPALENLAKDSFNITLKQKNRYVEIEQILLALVRSLTNVETFLATYGTTLDTLEKTIGWVVSEKEYFDKIYIWQEDCDMLFVGGIGKGMTGRVTPLLDSASEDFTRMVQKGRIEKIVDRESEIKKVAELLTGTRENILITGAAGSGKTSIVRGIAYKIIEGTEYKALKNKRIVSLDIGGIISGARSAGEISERLNKIMEEVKSSADIILFIDEIHNLVAGTGDKSAETSTIYSILEPHIVADKVQFIGATSLPNYRKYIEPNGAFARLFNLVQIPEASKEDTVEILKYVCRKFERKFHVLITYPALVKIVELSEKLIHERVLPDKALDILNRTVTQVANGSKYINTKEIAKEISAMTSIPVEAVTSDEASKLLQIEETMKKMVIGQDHAIVQIGAALKRARVGIRNENKPIASFLFIGTTGVGKTQTAKALAKSYFGNPKAMIRIDMSEYQQPDSISRLLGAPDGSTKGILTESVRTKPFGLILLDEIEKAHPNILLTFLQVLDDGRLTDSSGTLVDFTNTIIIATSNVGTRSIQQVFERGGTLEEMDVDAMKDVREKFAPEFLNRFSGIIIFNPLSMDNVRDICLLLLADIKKVAEEKSVKLEFKPELIEELIKRGFSPEWGARPLARVIEETVETDIATRMLKNEIKQGDTISIGLEVFAQEPA